MRKLVRLILYIFLCCDKLSDNDILRTRCINGVASPRHYEYCIHNYSCGTGIDETKQVANLTILFDST